MALKTIILKAKLKIQELISSFKSSCLRSYFDSKPLKSFFNSKPLTSSIKRIGEDDISYAEDYADDYSL